MTSFFERLNEHARDRLGQTLGRLFGPLDENLLPKSEMLASPPNPAFGEFAFPCFPLAKALGFPPQEIAKRLAMGMDLTGDPYLEAANAQGPYVNLTVKRSRFISETLSEVFDKAAAYGKSASGAGKTVVVDYSSPNIAKHLAFHHLRSTVIGHSLCRIFRHLGYTVVGINHLGDWGTQFGKLITAYLHWGPKDDELGKDPVGTLNDLYLRFQKESQTDPALLDEARDWFKRLEDGDPKAHELWKRFREVSLQTFERVYARLGITFDEVSGESSDREKIPLVLEEIAKRGLSVRSEGALIVDLSAYNMPPCLLKKADEASLYATRDLCAAISRAERFSFERLLYVVDSGQALHFRQIFKVLELMEYPWAKKLEHVPFGIIKFAGAKTRTREGNIILLEEVLDEAVNIIRQKITEKNPTLANADAVAEKVGIGAIFFADLSGRRVKDVNFDWNEMLNFDGRTGPYIQYSHARACSILRKGGIADPSGLAKADLGILTSEEEWQVVRQLARFPNAVLRAGKECEPSLIADSLLEVCESFHRYHTSGKLGVDKRVLADDPTARAARLYLTHCTRLLLANGLYLLGMSAPEAM